LKRLPGGKIIPLAIAGREEYVWLIVEPSQSVAVGATAYERGEQMIAEYSGTIPKRNDRVGIAGQEGVFEVADINSLMQTANLRSTDGQGHITRNIPWTSLKFLDRK
jgi:hypothetical protein